MDIDVGERYCLQEELCLECCLTSDESMGNGSSQSVVLGPSRSLCHTPVHFREDRYQRTAKYAQPMNRVLPKPVVGQRLRSTDNGHILHSAGTIRGQKPGSPTSQEHDDGDPEVMDILKRRSEMLENGVHDVYRQTNLRYNRMFHSDPDISRSRPTGSYSPDIAESVVSRRAGGGAAVRASKLKQRKKARAPEPPQNLDRFSGQFQRRSQSSTDISLNHSKDRSDKCRCASEWRPKPKAPSPPCFLKEPPPPPPLPVPTKTTENPLYRSEQRTNCGETTTNSSAPTTFEKQVIAAEKNRRRQHNYHAEEHDFRLEPRTTIFDSKSDLAAPSSNKKPVLIPHQPDPFQKEIEAVTKKIAQTRQKDGVTYSENTKDTPLQKAISPKPYYFSDKDVFRNDHVSPKQNGISQHISNGHQRTAPKQFVDSEKERGRTVVNPSKPNGKLNGRIESREVSPLQRFSPNRRQLKTASKVIVPTRDPKESFEESRGMPYQKEDSSIDIRLRPVLPRKTLNVPTFCRKEAWQALGSDGRGSSNQSTSDESISHFRRHDALHRNSDNIFTPFDKHRAADSQWTPRQDLDDSDTSSLNSDDAVIPKHQLGEFSTRFSLPTVMFSNLRPIGTDFSSSTKYSDKNKVDFACRDLGKAKHPKSNYRGPMTAANTSEINAVSHFKKFLGMRNKYLSEEDVSVSDSNWTFGEHGLQKRAKHYSSDLMLSDKKKYELMVRNDFGQFLGDILVTQSNDNHTSSNSENSNFSFYSTEGHVVYSPEKQADKVIKQNNRGKKIHKADQIQSHNYKKKHNAASKEFDKKSGIDLIRILEDEVRKRRVKEKLSIRQQLQMMKSLESECEEDENEEIDEAYFTEQKSLEGTSPPYYPSSSQFHKNPQANRFGGASVPSPLTHWTSSPALFTNERPEIEVHNRNRSESLSSSPDPLVWEEPNVPNAWMQRKPIQQNRRVTEKTRKLSEGTAMERSSSDDFPGIKDKCKSSHHDKKSASIYKQLMDIVRKEEKQLQKEQGISPGSRDSSYSQRESTHSSSSHDSLSSNSYSDSSSDQRTKDYSGKSGVPANDEFDCPDIKRSGLLQGENVRVGQSAFHAAFVQPFTPNKGYRPVPFDVAVPSASNCRMPSIQEACKVQAKVS